MFSSEYFTCMIIYISSVYFPSSALSLSILFLRSVYTSTADHFPILSIIAYFYLQIILRYNVFLLQWSIKHFLPPIIPLLRLIFYLTHAKVYSVPSLWSYRITFLHSVNFSLSEHFISIESSHSEWYPLLFLVSISAVKSFLCYKFSNFDYLFAAQIDPPPTLFNLFFRLFFCTVVICFRQFPQLKYSSLLEYFSAADYYLSTSYFYPIQYLLCWFLFIIFKNIFSTKHF